MALKDIYTASRELSLNSGWTFSGWTKTASADPTIWDMPYSFSSQTTTVNSTYTIYLVAEKPAVNTTYKLTYDANGGTGAPAQQTYTTTATSHQFTVSATKPTKTNAVCIGWADSSTATTAQYVAGGSITLQAGSPNKTIYAVWAEDMNNNNTPDSEETKYKVTYTDGVDTDEIFPGQTSFCLTDTPTAPTPAAVTAASTSGKRPAAGSRRSPSSARRPTSAPTPPSRRPSGRAKRARSASPTASRHTTQAKANDPNQKPSLRTVFLFPSPIATGSAPAAWYTRSRR